MKEFLHHHNVPFEVKDVTKDYNAAMEMIRRSGQQGVPVTTAGDEVIVGFDQTRLARIAEQYAGPKRPPLGLLGADAADYLARHPEVAKSVPEGTTGIYVGIVRPNSVAERAGIKPGDIVTSVAGKRARSMSYIDELIKTLKAGQSIPVRFLRNGKPETATLQF